MGTFPLLGSERGQALGATTALRKGEALEAQVGPLPITPFTKVESVAVTGHSDPQFLHLKLGVMSIPTSECGINK